MTRGIWTMVAVGAALIAAGCGTSTSRPESTPEDDQVSLPSETSAVLSPAEKRAAARRQKAAERKRQVAVEATQRRIAVERKRKRERRAAIRAWTQGFEVLYTDVTDASGTAGDRAQAEYLTASEGDYMSNRLAEALDVLDRCEDSLAALGEPPAGALLRVETVAMRACRRFTSAGASIGDGWEDGDIALIFNGSLALMDADFLLEDAYSEISGSVSGGGNGSPPAFYGGGGGGDLDCADVGGPFNIDPSNDPNGLDGDGDGIACEAG